MPFLYAIHSGLHQKAKNIMSWIKPVDHNDDSSDVGNFHPKHLVCAISCSLCMF